MRIIFYNPHNRLFRKDGAEFEARAKDCLVYWQSQGHEVVMSRIPKGSDYLKRSFAIGLLKGLPTNSVDRIAVFGHGTSGWCDLGVTLKTLPEIVPDMKRVLTTDARIGLYCCLTGAKELGLAGLLARQTGAVVMAHTTSGHTTRNPFKRMFYNHNIRDLWPTDKADRKVWIEWLKQKNAPFEALEASHER